ncbi:MAG: cytochrome c biogenesis protein ResB, partial [Actinomycetales bacterium]|nr:cytochrome c biogenesis protein ResB [Actinomycetales bacterium]
KVPDVTSGPQIGLVGYLLPAGVEEPVGFWRSVHPLPLEPVLVPSVWTGDLGLDAGLPQNVYRLDEDGMTQLTEDVEGTQRPVTVVVRPGETVDLPEGLGTLSFDALPRFVALDLRHDPTLTLILVFALTALAGLAVSLFAPRRRVWVRAEPAAEGTTVVQVAGLARGNDPGLEAEVERVLAAVRESAGAGAQKEDR